MAGRKRRQSYTRHHISRIRCCELSGTDACCAARSTRRYPPLAPMQLPSIASLSPPCWSPPHSSAYAMPGTDPAYPPTRLLCSDR
eukprot:1267008-Rhodomonas_salina.2